MVLLVAAVYECPNGHSTLATDPRILVRITEQEFIPFNCTGVMRNFARSVISLTTEGLSFNAIDRFLKSHRLENIISAKVKLHTFS